MIRSLIFWIMKAAVEKEGFVMKSGWVLCLLTMFGGMAVISTSAIYAETMNLRGKISNSAGEPIAKAIVRIVNKGVKDTTGTDGMYAITGAAVLSAGKSLPQSPKIVLENGFVTINLSEPSTVKVEFFSIEGKLLQKEVLPNAGAGSCRLNIDKKFHSNLLIAKVSVNQDVFTFHYVPSNGKYPANRITENSTSIRGKLSKLSAGIDTLEISADKYETKKISIASYDQQLDAALDSLLIKRNVVFSEGFEGINFDGGQYMAQLALGQGLMSISTGAAHSGRYSLSSDSNNTSLMKWLDDPISDSVAGIEFYLMAKKAEHTTFLACIGREGGSFGMLPNGMNCFMAMGIDTSDSLLCIHGQYTNAQAANPVFDQKKLAPPAPNRWYKCVIEYGFADSTLTYYLDNAVVYSLKAANPVRLDVFAALRDNSGAQGAKQYYIDDVIVYKR